MIGKIYTALTPFFNIKIQKNAFKQRPVLIISEIRNNDYTVLPVSTISRPENRDLEYDIKLDINVYPSLNLKRDSFIRTHKQTVIHRSDINREIGDLKSNYPQLYKLIFQKLSDFNQKILELNK